MGHLGVAIEGLYALTVDFGIVGGVSSLFVSREQRDRAIGFCSHSREVDGQVRALWVTDTFGVTWFINVEHLESVSASAHVVREDLVVVDSAWWADVAILASNASDMRALNPVDVRQLDELRAAGERVPADRLLQLAADGDSGVELRHVVWMRLAPAVVRRLAGSSLSSQA